MWLTHDLSILYWWTFGVLPAFGYHKWNSCEHSCPSFFFFFGHTLSFSFLGKYPRVEMEMLLHRVGVCWTLWETSGMILTVILPSSPPPMYPYWHWTMSVFLILAILIGVWQYLFVDFLQLFLVTNYEENFLMSLLTIWYLPLWKAYSFLMIKTVLLSLLNCRNYLWF